MRYLERDSFQNVAAMLVGRYMPRSAAKRLEISEVFRELYSAWFVLAPISNRAQGYWRPWWSPGVVMSWLRTEVNRFQRMCLGRLSFDWATAQVAPGAPASRIEDAAFIAHMEALLDHALGDTLRAGFARYVLGGLVWREKADAALARARAEQAGFMWNEQELWFLAQKPFLADGVVWADLREAPADMLSWSVWVADGKLHAQLSQPVVQRLKDSVKAVLATDALPEHKLRRINAAAKTFHHWARYAFDAQQQAQELEAWVWRRVNRHIVQNTPPLAACYFNLRQAPRDTQLHFGRASYLLDRGVTDEAWLNIWNPRR
ncbi:hypothetical protein SAMN04488503_3124 [Humidesulfovibrio mexicanus]|uniref:Uncharacterized protein n=2 Tax=Humidesulfovibrio mexicanus TaxID=147047 RepID=A0A239CHI3_9BACT|nr:hypothetical protein SAMN04488503_3124 [Humidesulfovibrio mexicanus]